MTTIGARAPAWPALACAAVALLLFVPTIGYGFVYDDHRFVAANPALSDPSIVWRAFTDAAVQTADGTHAGLWRPLRTLSFALDRLLFGDASWGGHLVNVLLHGLATGLVARLLQRLGAGAAAAAAGAMLYAAHPVQLECVAWVSSRGDLLAAALVWAALLADRPGRAWTAWALGGAALLAKEQAVVWPALLFIVVLAQGGGTRAALRRAVVPAAIVIAFGLLRHGLLAEPLQEGGLGSVGVVELVCMLAHQAWYMALPVGGFFDWQMTAPEGGVALVVGWCVGLAPLSMLLWRPARTPVAWFLAALVPTLFVQALVPLNIRVADRFLLFALPAVALVAARLATRSRAVLAATALAAACLAALTFQAQSAWADDAALWSRTAERAPGHWRAQAWLGAASLENGDVDAAVEHLERAASLAPSDAKTRFRFAEALEMQAARTPGDAVVRATVRARDEYTAAIACFTSGRQENRALLEPLARARSIDLTLAVGDTRSAAAALRAWLDRDPPEIPAAAAVVWNRDITRLMGHVAQHLDPQLERPLAPQLREWLVQP